MNEIWHWVLAPAAPIFLALMLTAIVSDERNKNSDAAAFGCGLFVSSLFIVAVAAIAWAVVHLRVV